MVVAHGNLDQPLDIQNFHWGMFLNVAAVAQLAVLVSTPTPDVALGVQGTGMVAPARYLDDVFDCQHCNGSRRTRGAIISELSIVVAPPAPHSPAVVHGTTVPRSCRDLDHIVEFHHVYRHVAVRGASVAQGSEVIEAPTPNLCSIQFTGVVPPDRQGPAVRRTERRSFPGSLRTDTVSTAPAGARVHGGTVVGAAHEGIARKAEVLARRVGVTGLSGVKDAVATQCCGIVGIQGCIADLAVGKVGITIHASAVDGSGKVQ